MGASDFIKFGRAEATPGPRFPRITRADLKKSIKSRSEIWGAVGRLWGRLIRLANEEADDEREKLGSHDE
jgi:hypothetical protein